MAFLSIEPLLEDVGELDLAGIDWVIAGGESGPGARPMQKLWVRNIRRQCRRSRVPFFFKQWGGFRKSKTGRELDGRTYDELPAVSSRPVLPAHRRLELADHYSRAWPGGRREVRKNIRSRRSQEKNRRRK